MADGKQKNIRVRWQPQSEYLAVVHYMQRLLKAGYSRLEAMGLAQACLPPARHLNDKELRVRSNASNDSYNNALAKLKALTPEALKKLLAKYPLERRMAEAPPHMPMGNSKVTCADYPSTGTLIYWSELEEALLARRIDCWISHGCKAGVARMFIEAQELEIAPKRRRSHGSLGVCWKKQLVPMLERGGKNARLVADYAFDPHQSTYREPRRMQELAVVKPLPAAIDIMPAPTPQPLAVVAAPSPSPVVVQTPVAPIAAAAAPSSQHEAARIFGVSLANAMVPLVQELLVAAETAAAERVRAQVHAEIRDALAANSQALVHQLTASVIKTMDAILGGGQPPQAQAQAQVQAVVPAEAQSLVDYVASKPEPLAAVRRVKVDIVGFEEGGHQMLVKKMLNGSADLVDLRFVHPDQRGTYAPHKDHKVILLTQRIPHSLREKIRACGCQTYHVKRSVGQVVTTITNMLGNQERALAA